MLLFNVFRFDALGEPVLVAKLMFEHDVAVLCSQWHPQTYSVVSGIIDNAPCPN